MEKGTLFEKIQDELQAGIWKQEFEIEFLKDELGKLEDDINKTSPGQITEPQQRERSGTTTATGTAVKILSLTGDVFKVASLGKKLLEKQRKGTHLILLTT